MSKIEFKKEQLEVLNSGNKNLIVSASAGSGKTTVMIQKIINLITNTGQKVKNILVLTYTKASAEEMKQKLINALYEQSQTDPKLLSQIDDVATADISTIHSFFEKLVKKYFMFLNVNPNFKILEDTQIEKIKSQALENVLELNTEKQPEKIKKLIEIYGKNRNEKTIFALIETIKNFLVAIDNPYAWSKNVATIFYEPNITKNFAFSVINKNFYETATYFKIKFEKLQKKCQEKNIEKYIKYCNTILSQLDAIKPDLTEKIFFQNCETLSNFTFERHTKVAGFEDLLAEINDAKKGLSDFCGTIKNFNYSQQNIQTSLIEIKEIVLILLELTQDFQAEFGRLKAENNCLDFNDLEKFASILLENPQIQEQIKNRYSTIFVDEYQDANRVQEKILSAISQINNRFMVGDVKQSIFGFRQTEPDIFLEMQEKFDSDFNSDVKFLNSNYRSHKKILDFVNLIFNQIMTNKTAKVDYKNNSNLNAQASYKDVPGQKIPNVEINIIKKDKKKEPLPPPEIYSVKDHPFEDNEQSEGKIEGFVVAKKIGELVGKKIYVPSLKTEKIIDFKDITILVRSRGGYFEDFCNVLTNFNIPIYANTKNSLYQEPEIQVFINLLKICRNYQDDNALAISLHSFFGGLNNNELAKIRLANPDKKYFYECVDCYDFKDIISDKISKFKQLIDKILYDINYQGMYFALTKLIDDFDYYSYFLTQNNGNESVAKLKKFVADFLTNEFNNNLCGFLNFADENGDMVKSPNFIAGENCVNITTIHSSKGLEFPIVIIANAGSDFTKSPQKAEIEINQKYGIGLKYYNKNNRTKNMSIMFDAMKQLNKEKEFAEKLRLLYVALTRAKNHLIIVGTSDKTYQKFESEFEVKHQKDFLSLIVKSLEAQDIEKINNNESIEKNEFVVNVYNELASPEIFDKTKKLYGKPSKIASEIFENYFNYEYPSQAEIALKNSVSSLTQKVYETYSSQNYSPKTFSVAESMRTNIVDIGILYHKILEMIDFKKVENIENINNFLKTNFKENDIKIIDINKLSNCINLLKNFSYNKTLKEQKFMMCVPHNQIVQNGTTDKILIQGIIDLILLGEKNILVDYKYSQITDENKLINKYKTQLKLYKMAVENVLGKRVGEVFLLNLFTEKMIKIDI